MVSAVVTSKFAAIREKRRQLVNDRARALASRTVSTDKVLRRFNGRESLIQCDEVDALFALLMEQLHFPPYLTNATALAAEHGITNPSVIERALNRWKAVPRPRAGYRITTDILIGCLKPGMIVHYPGDPQDGVEIVQVEETGAQPNAEGYYPEPTTRIMFADGAVWNTWAGCGIPGAYIPEAR